MKDQSNSIWQHLAYLEQKINQQYALIQELNEKMDTLIEQQQGSKAMAETIEYNFEQLKIETLEGTLNIGLTPQNDLPFEQLDLPEESPESSFTPMEQQIYNQLMPFLRKELPEVLNQFAQDYDIEIDQQQKHVLYQDIKNQLPQRIKEHTSQIQQNGRVIIEREQIPALIQHIQKEITQGIDLFLNQLKENEEDES
ncbi:spore germination protein GerPC [Piscibacillus halophilus]|uniref:Spore germination protein PC n=1 Tax=Piscibacillus halophilus TaxID=571933 RepID=A0A1H9B056_9BACI|nr:spore germination protein GerPC [Piscibacillus halophilus]SEP82412.1 spore germination protein PC [Piscibacillus halophilus]